MIDFKYVENRLRNMILTSLTVDKKKGIILRFQGLTIKLVNAKMEYNPMFHTEKSNTEGEWNFQTNTYVIRNVRYSSDEFMLSFFMDQLIFKSTNEKEIVVKFIPSITGANSKTAGYYEEAALYELTNLTVESFMRHCQHELVVNTYDKDLKQHTFFILANQIQYPGKLFTPQTITDIIVNNSSIIFKTQTFPIEVKYSDGKIDVLKFQKLTLT